MKRSVLYLVRNPHNRKLKVKSRPAEFRKSDLQVHTARDSNWDGERPVGNSEREEWSDRFIKACLEAGLQLVAITDHHEGVLCWSIIDKIKKIRHTSGIDLWVMPGMELTSKDSAQALILFDYDIDRALFEKARNRLGLVSDCKPENAKGIEVELIKLNIIDIQEELEKDDELKNKFIILPNVTPGGYKTIMRTGFHTRFKEMSYVGGYLDAKYPADLNQGDRNILEGAVPAWSPKPKGVITTSDSREANFEKLGQYPTWIKLAMPTAESIRQAMLASDSRISYDEPRLPEIHIEYINVEGSTVLKWGDNITLSPHYNAVIGGRGAGKSTILEYAKFALGRSAVDETGSKNWDPTMSRRKGIIEKTLGDVEGCVEVGVIINGAKAVLKRSKSSHDRIYYIVNGESREISSGDAREIVPMQSYSQGELSLLGDDNASSKLFKLITSPYKEKMLKFGMDAKSVGSDIESLLDTMVKGWAKSSTVRLLEAEKATLLARVGSLKKQLGDSENGVPKVVSERQRMKETQSWFQNLKSDTAVEFQDLLRQFGILIDRYEKVSSSGSLPRAASAQKAARLIQETAEELRAYYRSLSSEYSSFVSELSPIENEWKAELDMHNIEYSQALAMLSDTKKQRSRSMRSRGK